MAETAWQFPVREPGVRLSAARTDRRLESGERRPRARSARRLSGAANPHLAAVGRGDCRQHGSAADRQADVGGAIGRAGAESSVIAQAVLSAVERAADPTRHSGQIVSAGLQPWKVDKVFSALPDGQMGVASVNTAQVSARAHRPLAEVAQMAHGMVASAAGGVDYQASPPTRGFRLLVNRLPQDAGTQNFFSGIAIAPASEARRPQWMTSGQNVEQLKRMAQSRRNLQAILRRPKPPSREPATGWPKSVRWSVRWTNRAGPKFCFNSASAITTRDAGRWPPKRFRWWSTATANIRSPVRALVWLVQYYASGEAAWRHPADRSPDGRAGDRRGTDSRQAKATNAKKADRIATTLRPIDGPVRQIVTQGGLIGPADQATARAQQAATLAKRFGEVEASLLSEPRVGFPLAIAHRRQGYPRQAERFYTSLCRTRPHDAWWAAAECELWLPERHGLPSKPVAPCVRTAAKPRLDGQLDDAVWRAVRPLELHSAGHDDTAWSAVAMVAYDEEFLYLAASCRQVEAIRRV